MKCNKESILQCAQMYTKFGEVIFVGTILEKIGLSHLSSTNYFF